MYNEENLKSAYHHFNQAYEFQKSGDFSNAIQNYRVSISKFPTVEAYINLGMVLSKEGKYKEAIEECYAVLRINKNEYSAYNYIGYYLIKLKRYEEAKVWLDTALQFKENKSKHSTYFNLGIIYEKRGDWYKAIKMFNKSFKLKPNFSKAKTNLLLLTARLN
ncbi:MAG: tetratricopeptide repeat protein [Bacteroidota bacterium]